MAEVKAHPWLNGPVPALGDIQADFKHRFKTIEAENEAKRIQKEQERAAQMAAAGGAGASRRQYKNLGAHRGDEEEEEGKHDVAATAIKRILEPYQEVVKKNTEFFTTEIPENLVNEIGGYLQSQGHLTVLDKNKYKFKVTLKQEKGTEEESAPLELTVKILDASNGRYCVEFSRTAGDQLQFFDEFSKIRDELAHLVIAA